MRITLIAIAIMPLIGLTPLNAQQANVNLDWAPQKNTEGLVPFGANTISPEVHDDHTVTFRVKAPDAQAVSLTGDFLRALNSQQPLPFSKGTDGIWSLNVGPVKPEIYYYRLIIDGVVVVDPANTYVGFAAQPGFSILVVHGDGPAWYDAKNVAHGTVTRHVYRSNVTNGERDIYVYTPPGYDSKKKYPVLYLVGGSGEVAATWSLFGNVNFIEDNLIAEGKALPMIIAMPNNQVVHRMDPKHTQKSFPLFNDEMLKEVIPFVEKHYSVKADKHNRALAGLSMGGRHTQIVGLNNLDTFGSFGILSAGESLELNPGVFDDPKLNDKIDYLFVGAGTNETRPNARHVVFHEELEKRNVKHEYYIGSDGAHDFITWRHLLYYRFLPELWRKK
jgi:Putative esterase/Carbohydrate-binding module 48 (Isoamylase N-terminal domain)